VGTAYGNERIFTALVSDIDGNFFNTKKIGDRVWMAENLKTTHYRDGSPIPMVSDATAWAALTSGARSIYNNDSTANYATYGRLYNWYTVTDAKGLCPTAWHTPTDDEWTNMLTALGGNALAGGKLKESGTAHWTTPNTGADNTSGFIALPGGNRSNTGVYAGLGTYAGFWSALEFDTSNAWIRNLANNSAAASSNFLAKSAGLSVRCVKDTIPVVTVTAAIGTVTKSTATSGGTISIDGGAPVTDRGVCWAITASPTIANSKTTDGTGIGSFASTLTGLKAGTTYYTRAYATNSAGTAYGSQLSFITDTIPLVTTNAVSAISYRTATCGGNVTADNGDAVTARGVCWNTATNPTIANNKTTDASGTGAFTSSITGLTAGTTYYVRAFATNSIGTAYGTEQTFVTTSAILPVLTTNAASLITNRSALSGGTINDGGGDITVRGVCWAITATPTIANSKTNDGVGAVAFTSQITGLAASTVYYVRSYALNSAGIAYGPQVTFTTLAVAVAPTINSSSVINIGKDTATCGGVITTDGGADITERGMCWAITATPTTANYKAINGTGIGTFTCKATGLKGGTTYYLRAFATNSMGTMYATQQTFVTDTTPTLTTTAATTILQRTATSGGNITTDNGDAVSARGVCWSTTTNPTIADSKTTDGTGIGAFTSSITGLTAATLYYVRAYATNATGTAYGAVQSFTTAAVAIPTNTTDAASAITQRSVISGGTISNDGGVNVTARGVCWATTANPTTANSLTTDGTGAGVYVSNITGLTAATLYYIRAYATNSVGTAYGAQVSVTTTTTANLPVLTTTPPYLIKNDTATSGATITSDGGADITARGVCWATTTGPTTALTTKTVNGIGTGTFIAKLTSLAPNTTYYVRAYATNSMGTSYGNEVSFTTIIGLVAYYPFNGNANDLSGNANNGTVNGATPTTDRKGVASAAYSFNGSNQYLDIANVINFSRTDNYTLNFWINSSSLAVNNFIFSNENSAMNFKGYTGFVKPDGKVVLDLLDHYISSRKTIETSQTLAANQWHFISFIQKGSPDNIEIWINGQKTTTTITINTLGTYDYLSSISSYIGRRRYDDQRFTGKIDDIRIYNRVLTATEIQLLYNE
jgi:uncharacterized protein (TIGR02145 family)